MITNNFKNKMLKSIKDNISCFSFTVNDEKVEAIDAAWYKDAFNETFIVKKGKKTFLKITL